MPFPGTVSSGPSGRTTTGQDSQEGQLAWQLGTVIGRSVVPSGKMCEMPEWMILQRISLNLVLMPTWHTPTWNLMANMLPSWPSAESRATTHLRQDRRIITDILGDSNEQVNQ
uniref:(northern house mosquito) hypothetical protein n=1 Tax=Culex pipiens TaxID=7175 RepID=A0A8D8BWI2_CULPI